MVRAVLKKESSKKLKAFFAQFSSISYRRHEIIYHAEDIPSGIFYVKRGCIKIYAISKEGEELDLILFKSGNVFPLMWAINNISNNYHAEAMTDVEVWRAPKEKFLQFLKENPDILMELTRRILARFGGLLERLEYQAFGDAYEKVASILLILSERFGKIVDNSIVIKVPLTHKDVANLVGITRETATLEMGKLTKNGIISHIGKNIVIKDIKKLRKESFFN